MIYLQSSIFEILKQINFAKHRDVYKNKTRNPFTHWIQLWNSMLITYQKHRSKASIRKILLKTIDNLLVENEQIILTINRSFGILFKFLIDFPKIKINITIYLLKLNASIKIINWESFQGIFHSNINHEVILFSTKFKLFYITTISSLIFIIIVV